MSFGEAIKTCWRKYATFEGRARRSEYWWFYLFIQLVSIPFALIFTVTYFVSLWPVVEAAEYGGEVQLDALNFVPMVIGIALMTLVSLVLLLPSLAAMVRRLHDMGQPGWWILLSFIGLGIVPLIMAVMDSQPYDNPWGPDPKAGERSQYLPR